MLTAGEPAPVEINVSAASVTTANVPELPPHEQLEFISGLYKSYCTSYSNVTPPDDFLKFASLAMSHLQSIGRSNVVYNLVRVLGTMREDGSDSLLPVKRMPMGLIERVIGFFSCSTVAQV